MDKPLVKNLKLFFYWINERHAIYLKKEADEPWPWTKDKILREYKFTNVYRNLDRVSKQLHEQVNMGSDRLVSIFFKICLFRMFNHPATYIALKGENLNNQWNVTKAKWLLHKMAKAKMQVFTGAYIITNNGSKRSKIDLVCEAVDKLHKDRKKIVAELRRNNSIEMAVRTMSQYPMVGEFIAYELVTDFRHTKILCDADDIMEWANPGPGAKRGINRIWYDQPHGNMRKQFYIEKMKELLDMSRGTVKVGKHHQLLLGAHTTPLEMRDIEHSLCEFDKYMRVKLGQGKPRSKYRYVPSGY